MVAPGLVANENLKKARPLTPQWREILNFLLALVLCLIKFSHVTFIKKNSGLKYML